ncbi:2,3-diphosphoglycerate-dependent phosphoglycerate mutase [Sodalis-like secondary symbiont of Drepanosiphum platanoidis]|uniref:2,3-diphosphoglycerate-dependent phosphoglycerate mutase n=1 Tax=Sodalis-like secondary symbiont of Drepanosiphum platanoidis TaxID=2994493 RepID=UPI0034647174
MKTTKLVIIRHGESQWNLENKFTGWTDIDLSKKGLIEAKKAGILLKKLGFSFDLAYTSILKRSINTLHIILNELNQLYIPIKKSWRLNERHYGALQGLNKKEVSKKYGNCQVEKWRRGFFDIPPKINKNDNRFPGNNLPYINIKKKLLPVSESLEYTVKRVYKYWNKEIFPKLKINKHIIISAHGNSIRAIIKLVENIKEKDLFHINIPTGSPMIYEFNKSFEPIKRYFL